MKSLSTTGTKILKIVHLICAVSWLGGAAAMMLLIACMPEDGANEIHAYTTALKHIDDWLIIGGANGCVLTGLIYGICTKWGFFRHRWIVLKWVLTIFMMASGTFIMGPLVNGNAAHPADLAFYLAPDGEFGQSITTIVRWGLLQISLLIIVFAISVIKPRKSR